MLQGATVYPGVPTAGVFSNTITESSPLCLDITTGNMYYYKSGTGVVQVIGIPLAGPINLPGPVTVTGTLTVTSTSSFLGSMVLTGNISASGNIGGNTITATTSMSSGSYSGNSSSITVMSTTQLAVSRSNSSPAATIANTSTGTGLSATSSGGIAISATGRTDGITATVDAASTGVALRGVSSSASNTAVFADGSVGGIALGVTGVINNFNTNFTTATGIVAILTFLNNKPGASTNGEWMEVYNGARRGWIPWWPH
mgnify:CR=1 FL=1